MSLNVKYPGIPGVETGTHQIWIAAQLAERHALKSYIALSLGISQKLLKASNHIRVVSNFLCTVSVNITSWTHFKVFSLHNRNILRVLCKAALKLDFQFCGNNSYLHQGSLTLFCESRTGKKILPFAFSIILYNIHIKKTSICKLAHLGLLEANQHSTDKILMTAI